MWKFLKRYGATIILALAALTSWAMADGPIPGNYFVLGSTSIFGGSVTTSVTGLSITSGSSNTIAATSGTFSNTVISGNGAVSTSPVLLSGTLFTGGSGTTTLPQLYINAAGTTAPSTYSTSGTYFGINAVSGCAGNYFDFHTAGGSSVTSMSCAGRFTTSKLSITAGVIGISGNSAAAAWTTSGIAFTQAAATFTDTSSSGTIAAEYINAFQASTLSFSNVTTVTAAYGTYFVDPIQGTNATLSAKYALGADSLRINGPIATGGTIPAVTGTGTPTITTGSTDTAGEVTSGTTATSVIITFVTAKTNAPFCNVTPQTQLVAFAYTISTTAITVTQTATTGEKIDYECIQH